MLHGTPWRPLAVMGPHILGHLRYWSVIYPEAGPSAPNYGWKYGSWSVVISETCSTISFSKVHHDRIFCDISGIHPLLCIQVSLNWKKNIIDHNLICFCCTTCRKPITFDSLWLNFTFYAFCTDTPWLTWQWRHNESYDFSNLECLLNRLFRRRSKKTSNLCVTGFGEGNPPADYPHKRPSFAENVSIWWRHRAPFWASYVVALFCFHHLSLVCHLSVQMKTCMPDAGIKGRDK